MENFILFRKRLSLEKDKVNNLSIPVALKPHDVVIHIETKTNQEKPVQLDFYFKQLAGNSIETTNSLTIELKGFSGRFKPTDLTAFENKNHLLLAIKSSQLIDIELSIEAN